MGWTPAQLPSLNGKTYAITGGNSGIGLETACILAAKGARVVITSRSDKNAETALAEIRRRVPSASVSSVRLDLASLESVDAAAAAIADTCPTLDALVNNAGVMQTPRLRTAEGFELQLGTNHLGHFRLASKLLPRIEASGGRIVAVSSIVHKTGTIHLDDLNFETRRYDPTDAYGQSKLANLMFALELHRRLISRGSKATAYGAHPGYAATNLQSSGVGLEGGSTFFRVLYKVTNALMAQSAEKAPTRWPSRQPTRARAPAPTTGPPASTRRAAPSASRSWHRARRTRPSPASCGRRRRRSSARSSRPERDGGRRSQRCPRSRIRPCRGGLDRYARAAHTRHATRSSLARPLDGRASSSIRAVPRRSP